MEGLGLLVGETICAAKFWAELLIQEQKTWGQVPSTKKLDTAVRLIELGHGDLVPDSYKQANGLE